MIGIKTSLFSCYMLLANSLQAQEYNFSYQRKLEAVTDTWHKITIPNDAYSKINEDFSDVRVLGITSSGDTIEAPYILKALADTYSNQTIKFNLINKVRNKNNYYYTFELPASQLVNYIKLSFNRSNFDWLVSLDGSQNQQEWFNITKANRIVGIKNRHTSYTYTTLEFNEVKYKYLRLKIPSKSNPQFSNAIIEKKVVTCGQYIIPKIESQRVLQNKKEDNTELLLSLTKMMPISYINVIINDSIDYYRPVTVQYAVDSIKNKNGWQYLYKTLFSSTLSSLNTDGFRFSNQVIKYLKLIIENGDNEPLKFGKTKLHGNPYVLEVRFTKPATYYLVYGNTKAYVPNYDISRFEGNIPAKLKKLTVGNEQLAKKVRVVLDKEPLFKDTIWLWTLMIFAIFILGWFSLKMIKNR